MASMSGYKDLPKERSILGQEDGKVTLGITTPGGRGFPSTGTLIGSIRRITNEKIANTVGKCELFDDVEDAGFEAAFDVPKVYADEIMAAARANGVAPACVGHFSCLFRGLLLRSACTRLLQGFSCHSVETLVVCVVDVW